MKAMNLTATLASTILAFGLMAAGPAFADDAMKKDAMGDGMKKETMSKDCKKDDMSKDCTKDGKMMKKGGAKNDMMKKDDMGKDKMSN